MGDITALVKRLGVSDRIKILGHKNHEEVAELLTQCHIFLHPSVTTSGGIEEGIPNAVKEAMAVGMPVVSTLHSGIPELVEHGVSGFLVREHDIEGLVEHLSHLITHPESWAAMGREGRRKIEQDFELEKENDRLISLLR